MRRFATTVLGALLLSCCAFSAYATQYPPDRHPAPACLRSPGREPSGPVQDISNPCFPSIGDHGLQRLRRHHRLRQDPDRLRDLHPEQRHRSQRLTVHRDRRVHRGRERRVQPGPRDRRQHLRRHQPHRRLRRRQRDPFSEPLVHDSEHRAAQGRRPERRASGAAVPRRHRQRPFKSCPPTRRPSSGKAPWCE